MATEFLPAMMVRVPRAVAPQYWTQPWADVLGAAKLKIDGLRMFDPSTDMDDVSAWKEHDACFLREGEGGKTWLYRQGW